MKKTIIFFYITISLIFLKLAIANTSFEIKQNIKPIGQVYVKSESKPTTQKNTVEPQEIKQTKALSGEGIYQQYCSVCHTSGAAGAPKLGDKNAWQPRIQQGQDVLINHAINGYKVMPPKGTCSSCNNDDIANAVKYMTEKSQ